MDVEEGKCQRVCDIINTPVQPQIPSIDGVSFQTDFNARKKMMRKETIHRKSESSGIDKKKTRNNDFINTFKSKTSKDPTKSMRKSYTRTPRHSLTRPIKARRLERRKNVLTYLKRKKKYTVKLFAVEKIC